jgi:hypothetical protein
MKNYKTVFIINFLACFFIIIFVIVSKLSNIPFSNFSNNVYSEFGIPFYQGVINKFGIIFWTFTVTICFFVYLVTRSTTIKNEELKIFILISGILFTILLLDDFFLLHGYLIPRLLKVPQNIVLITYAIISLFFIIFYRKLILITNFYFLIIGFICLGLSAGIDVLSHFRIIHLQFRYIFDDGFKFIGIINLAVYYFLLGQLMLKQR